MLPIFIYSKVAFLFLKTCRHIEERVLSGKNVGDHNTAAATPIKSQMSFNLLSSDDTLLLYSIDRLDY